MEEDTYQQDTQEESEEERREEKSEALRTAHAQWRHSIFNATPFCYHSAAIFMQTMQWSIFNCKIQFWKQKAILI